MKKIIILTQNLDTGGVQKSVSMLVNALCTKFECTLVLFEANKNIVYALDERIKIQSIPFVRHDTTTEGLGLAIFNQRKLALQKLVEPINADMIFSFEDYHNILSLELETQAQRIISCRISLKNFYTKSAQIHLLPSEFYFQKIRTLYEKAAAVVCVSVFIRNELSSISNKINAINIYNGIDKDTIDLITKEPQPLEYDYILHVGRLHSQKGQKDLILAYSYICNEIEEKLVIIGEGPIEEELKMLVSELKLDERIVFLGSISSPYAYMKYAKVCIIPSYQEGFSNTVMEMMYCSSLIASRYNGHDEILQENGNLFDIGDINTLAGLMLKYTNNIALLDTLKSKQSKAVEGFNMTTSTKQYVSLIESVLND